MVVSDAFEDYIAETFAASFKPLSHLSGETEETLNNLGEVSCNLPQ
jgi:hypothetical protein